MGYVIIVTSECGDYYCKGEHVHGVFDTDERANTAIDTLKGMGGLYPNEFKKATWKVNDVDLKGDPAVSIVGPA